MRIKFWKTILGSGSFLILCAFLSCRRGGEENIYAIQGQVISIYSIKNEITLKHEAIEGYMPAMTMPFKVKDVEMLIGLERGDLVKGRLVVTRRESYLEGLEKTGHSDLEDAATRLPSGVRLYRKGDRVSDFSFIDQDGKERKLSDFRGAPLAFTFIYTRCPLPDFCPLMDFNFATVEAAIEQGEGRIRAVRLLSITFDPDYDTPAVLKAHGKKLGADFSIWSFLTGERDALIHFGEQFGITVVRNEDAVGDIVHSLRTVVLDGDGVLVKIFRGNGWTPESLLKVLEGPGSVGRKPPEGLIPMEPGGGLFFSNYRWHRSEPNLGGKWMLHLR